MYFHHADNIPVRVEKVEYKSINNKQDNTEAEGFSMNEVKKCSKCGSESITKRDVTVMGFWQRGFKAYAYICEKCGYIELYREVKKRSQ